MKNDDLEKNIELKVLEKLYNKMQQDDGFRIYNGTQRVGVTAREMGEVCRENHLLNEYIKALKNEIYVLESKIIKVNIYIEEEIKKIQQYPDFVGIRRLNKIQSMLNVDGDEKNGK